MKMVSEYLFAGLFYLATVTSWLFGEIGAGFIILCLGVYFPTRNLINELLHAVNEWDVTPNMKFLWGAMSMLLMIMPLKLLVFDIPAFFIGFLGVCLMSYLDESQA